MIKSAMLERQVNECSTYDDLSDFIPFNPSLDEYHKRMFDSVTSNLLNKFKYQRVQYLKEIIQQNKFDITFNNLEGIKFLSTLSILKDLLSQEWRIYKNKKSELLLAPPILHRNDDKNYLRQQLQHERNAQLNIPSVKKFILKMEKKQPYKGTEVSILNLIGDNSLLASKIESIKHVNSIEEKIRLSKTEIKPYLQLVDNSTCVHSGYKLMEIWRYFRYTWSIPYKSTPGRKLYYLIRDAAQPYHPIMGIAALGNCVLQLTDRDNHIGWTLESIKKSLKKRTKTEVYEETLKGKLGLKRQVEKTTELETEDEYHERIRKESNTTLRLMLRFLDEAISEISIENLISREELLNPSTETINKLKKIAESLKDKQLNNKRTSGPVNWKIESCTPLYTKKRATELARLLEAKRTIQETLETEKDTLSTLKRLLTKDKGKALNVALQANRKSKIGSNLMEIIVCGAIPPYNEILSGKLVSMLMCSPMVVKEYNRRYSNQASEIASRMKGEEVIRDSRLAFLGTTSLYHMGSSQYNRIKIPVGNDNFLEYRKLGETIGFGSVFFSQETTDFISSMVQLIDGGRRINNVFGEGTSPRLRLLRSGLSVLGLSSEGFLRHNTRRIVYGIELAKNSCEFLRGETNELNYYLPLDGNEAVYTDGIIDYWRKRWLLSRIESVDIINRLRGFDKNTIKLSRYF